MRRLIPVVALLAALVAGVCLADAVGDPFPQLRLNDVETGEVVDVKEAVGGSVGAVVFMQTSCGVCRKELMALKDIGINNPSLRVVAVSADSGSPGRVANYKKTNGFPFRFVHDPEFEAGSRFGFKFTPGMILTRRDGTIALVKGGYKPEDLPGLEKTIDELTR
jgi:peroxiredoxin